ncbi:hypothetical protein CLOSTASPAR_06395 [[Clostridium] asparagiforme DSM 15981]|uniref:Uncharacterized protein n=1 Tax=[Clostridium] asparagiforme DSM 15981 TaxID=518636 RepID=C0DAU0_9FIRM|nr:hypothetical protein CLOSTASPAR_06395 [[Clostridium] asparagiforme DSM 15981]
MLNVIFTLINILSQDAVIFLTFFMRNSGKFCYGGKKQALPEPLPRRSVPFTKKSGNKIPDFP